MKFEDYVKVWVSRYCKKNSLQYYLIDREAVAKKHAKQIKADFDAEFKKPTKKRSKKKSD